LDQLSLLRDEAPLIDFSILLAVLMTVFVNWGFVA
jgi:hypothetical protein